MQILHYLLFSVLFSLIASPAFAQVLEADSLALVDFYNENGGEFWFDDDNWLDGPVSSWYGISVENGRVTEVDFYDNGVTGAFPVSLTNLSALRELQLGKNELTGTLPSEIGNIDSLIFFSVGQNQLSGEIPTAIGNCTSLETFNISVNAFEGTFPTSFSNLINLTRITAHKNQLSGPFPAVLLDMPWLTYLLLETNNFSGLIPPEIDSLKNLTTFNLLKCQFSGPMPKIHNLTNLTALHLGENDLEGDLDTILGYHPNLYYTTLGNNHFTGRISTSHFNPDELELAHFNGNAFTEIDDWFAFADTGVIRRFYINGNALDFDDLEPNAHLPISNYQYDDQAKLGQRDTIIMEMGEDYTFSSTMQSNAVIYQWYFNGDTIPGATGKQYTVDDFETSKAGAYHFDARHPDLPELTLESHPTYLMEETSSVRELEPGSWNVFPNPAADYLQLLLDKDLQHADIILSDPAGQRLRQQQIGITGRIDIHALPPGIYTLQIRTSEGVGVKKVVKIP